MTEVQKTHLAKLKAENKAYALKQRWKQNVLLQECLNKLSGSWEIATDDIQTMCIAAIDEINRRRAKNPNRRVADFGEVQDTWMGQSVYLVWDEITLPILHCNLQKVKQSIEDVIAVSFDTWILSERLDVAVLCGHNGQVDVFFLDLTVPDVSVSYD